MCYVQITRTEQLSTLIKAYRKKHGITQTVISQLVGLRVATTSDSENKPG
jgi:HTH-type transcriptional regulator/antitoxin HipB